MSIAILLSVYFSSLVTCLPDSRTSIENGEAMKTSALLCKADILLYLEVEVEMETFQILDAIEPC